MVGSFYDPDLEEGCAFEELISFHGGLGGPQTRPFLLYPAALPLAGRAASSARPRCNALLLGWRRELQARAEEPPAQPEPEVPAGVVA